jgi:hypothetical protein
MPVKKNSSTRRRGSVLSAIFGGEKGGEREKEEREGKEGEKGGKRRKEREGGKKKERGERRKRGREGKKKKERERRGKKDPFKITPPLLYLARAAYPTHYLPHVPSLDLARAAYPTQVLGEELCLVIEGRLKRLILLVPSVLHWND